WPAVGAVVLDVAARAGLGAMRIIRSAARSPIGVTVRRLSVRLEAEAAQRGVLFPATATGLDEAGTLDAARLARAIDRLAAGPGASAELATHPGEPGDPDLARYRWGYVWHHELAALTDPATRTRVEAAGFRLGTYADLGVRR
ncbi:MAG TPA: ChbG/HpnK family deacetylase, partial [Acidimicrobiales bacterium]|nr:ChbG/HpnK family deacetylase [Acidimicrobiales bacterium]